MQGYLRGKDKDMDTPVRRKMRQKFVRKRHSEVCPTKNAVSRNVTYYSLICNCKCNSQQIYFILVAFHLYMDFLWNVVPRICFFQLNIFFSFHNMGKKLYFHGTSFSTFFLPALAIEIENIKDNKLISTILSIDKEKIKVIE